MHCQLLRGVQIRLLIIPQLPAADFQTFIKLALQHSSERQLLRLMEIQRRIFILLAPSRDFAAQNQIFCTLRVRQLRNRPDLALCRLDMLLLQMKPRHRKMIPHRALSFQIKRPVTLYRLVRLLFLNRTARQHIECLHLHLRACIQTPPIPVERLLRQLLCTGKILRRQSLRRQHPRCLRAEQQHLIAGRRILRKKRQASGIIFFPEQRARPAHFFQRRIRLLV